MGSAEVDDAKKRNTDCVYFLASPLTCKKGNECEYRHSESARINPRDCRYWISGNCLNVNCAFRHPPLEERPAAELSGSLNAGKSRVPCFFYFQGYCAKGEKCPYMHNTMPPAYTAAMEAYPSQKLEVQSSVVKGGGGAESNERQQATSKGIEVNPLLTKASSENEVVKASLAEGSGSTGLAGVPLDEERMELHAGATEEERHARNEYYDDDDNKVICEEEGTGGGGGNGTHSPGVDNGVDSEEWWGEESPGFDVLVDDGPDQLVYMEDGEFLSTHEMVMDPERVRLMMQSNDLLDFNEYDHHHHVGGVGGVYDEPSYYEPLGGGQYDPVGYELYDEKLRHGLVDSFDHPGRPRIIGYGDGRGVEGEIHEERRGDIRRERQRIGNNDLRNRIAKRRRVQPSDENRLRRRHNDRSVREYPPPREGRRNENYRPKQRRPLGRADSKERIRSFDDMIPEPPPRLRRVSPILHCSPIIAQPRDFDGVFKGKESRNSGGGFATNTNTTTSRTKEETWKNPANFSGPKTLAQIRAEKNKLEGQNEEPKTTTSNSGDDRHVLPLRSKITSSLDVAAEVSDRESRPLDRTRLGRMSDSDGLLFKGADFEGPKPLSAILKAKRRADPIIDRNPIRDRESPSMKRGRFDETKEGSSSREVAHTKHPHSAKGAGGGSPSDMLATNNNLNGDHRAEMGSSRHEETKASQDDGLDDDDDFGYEDEEDDFAKKLDGLFS